MSVTLAEAQARVRVLGLVESLGVAGAEVEAALRDLILTLESEDCATVEGNRVAIWALVNDVRRLRNRLLVTMREVGR